MAKRFGRTVVSDRTVSRWKYEAWASTGSKEPDLAGDCERPVVVGMTGLRDRKLAGLLDLADPNGTLDIAEGYGTLGEIAQRHVGIKHVDLRVPCRRCRKCLQRKRRHWHLRAMSEANAVGRTWFTTLTLRPEIHWKHAAMARDSLARSGWNEVEISTLQGSDPDRWFQELCAPFMREFQLYLKRLRKGGAVIRYMFVFERHKSGLPHLHALLHEQSDPVRHATLVGQWPHGFSVHKLADRAGLGYVTKYIAKDLVGRPRASRNYGSPPGFLWPSPTNTLTSLDSSNHTKCDDVKKKCPANRADATTRTDDIVSDLSRSSVSGSPERIGELNLHRSAGPFDEGN